jgi:hypothetical protein
VGQTFLSAIQSHRSPSGTPLKFSREFFCTRRNLISVQVFTYRVLFCTFALNASATGGTLLQTWSPIKNRSVFELIAK